MSGEDAHSPRGRAGRSSQFHCLTRLRAELVRKSRVSGANAVTDSACPDEHRRRNDVATRPRRASTSQRRCTPLSANPKFPLLSSGVLAFWRLIPLPSSATPKALTLSTWCVTINPNSLATIGVVFVDPFAVGAAFYAGDPVRVL